MRKLLPTLILAASAFSMPVAAQVAELNVGDATNLTVNFGNPIETPDFNETYQPLTRMTIDGFEFYIQADYDYCRWQGVDEAERLAYFYFSGMVYIEITAPAGQVINSFTWMTEVPSNGGVLGGGSPITVVDALDNASTRPPIGVVSYEGDNQNVIKWINDTPETYNTICVRTPAFRRRNIYKMLFNDQEEMKQCTITTIPATNAPLYAGNCGTEEAPEGLADLRLAFSQTGVSVNTSSADVITLSYDGELIREWEEPTIVEGETDSALLAGLTPYMLRNPGEYTLSVPEGFFMFEGRPVVGGDAVFTLFPKTDNTLLTYLPIESEEPITELETIQLAISEEAGQLFQTGFYNASVTVAMDETVTYDAELQEIEDGVVTLSFPKVEGPAVVEFSLIEGSFTASTGTVQWGPYIYNTTISATIEVQKAEGVDMLYAGESEQKVYTIDGREVKSTQSLAPGLYIIGGKKMVVK